MPMVPGAPYKQVRIKGSKVWKPDPVPPPKDRAEYQRRVEWAKMSLNPAATARRLGVKLSTRNSGGIDISGSDRR